MYVYTYIYIYIYIYTQQIADKYQNPRDPDPEIGHREAAGDIVFHSCPELPDS